MSNFNPFDQPISEINASDIYSLDVPEGYYYEYKQSMIERVSIAKSIASFANTYGGILFIGIEENPETNKPQDYFTLNGDDPSKYKETIRDVVQNYISGFPRFTTYSFAGTNQDGEQGYTIVVDVPESQLTPHINNDGRVYRRTGEGSDPYKPLSDPGILDDLHQRKKDWNEKVQEFCKREVGLTNYLAGSPEEDIRGEPMLEIYAIPTTLGEPVCSDVLFDIDGFKEIFELSEMPFSATEEELDELGALKMGTESDTVRGTSSGVVAQQSIVTTPDSENPNINQTPLTMKFFVDGSSKIFLPLPTIDSPIFETEDKTIWELIERQEVDESENEIQYIDGTNLLATLIPLFNSYMTLLEEYEWPSDSNNVYIKSRFRNGYRTLLFFDSEWFQELSSKYGVPVCYDDVVEIPRNDPLQYDLGMGEHERLSSVLSTIALIFESMGLPVENYQSINDEFAEIIVDEIS